MIMKKIVLMTDFSENARKAIKYGINLFGDSVEYLLVHSYTVRKATGSFADIGALIRQDALNDFENEIHFIKNEFSHFPDLKISTICKEGDPVDVINNLDNSLGIDLIVMGTKGASGLSKIFIGSVTASLIRKTKYPVLSVPEEAVFKSIDKIVFAADLALNRNAVLTYPLKSIARKNNSEVLLLHILNEGELAKGFDNYKLNKLEMSADLEGIKKTMNFVETNNKTEGIVQFCIKNNADLLTVIARHNTFFDKLFHKSVSQELAYSLKMPLLTLEDSF
ncbi:MAG: hypothetical protein GQ574_29180 [Crocinitomix sp.]|nr:hypothetical protein [Crocinitomix sp.]